ncbi:DUF6194 family protein [Mycobacteroides salmoniphilum]|uniref:DUF6194 domain-containing protein n=1 Tax=Mycobacteroides salmoniphilum TaxID=404941 RepID=A0A4V3I0M2_9MYCO|nr:DUF6194 family protein [Mycobacteroides salmoniphilum]TDZ90578.1 hypothetical protein CCUG62472_03831 [Mycobacteroides salmoniphilum]TEA00526.1 hypothetical protein CCUG60884_04418 [Mycobacteroides salmoniphilum]
MDEGAIIEYIVTTFPDLRHEVVQGNWFFFRGSDRQMPIITLMSNEAFDTYSDLGRPSVYRLNIGVSGDTFDGVVSVGDDEPADADYTEFDRVLPHPEYGGAKWVCVVNPGEDTFGEVIRPLLTEAYARGRRD